MQDFVGATPGQQRALAMLFAVALVGLLIVAAGMGVWMMSAWPGGSWGSDHMNRMMGGGRDSSSDVARPGSANETVIIEDFEYSPGNLHVPVGASLTWTNRDSAPHSATDLDGPWDTGVLGKAERATVTFNVAATFDYFCTVHPNMKARLVVQ